MPALLENHAVLAVFVFCARLTDVSLGTLRTILVIRGHKAWAATLGFFEVLTWLAAAGLVFQNLDVWYLAVAYAGGFAAGNVVGMWIEARLAIGHLLVRAISAGPASRLAEALRAADYGVVELSGTSASQPVEVLYLVERRRRLPDLLRRIEAVDPEAICTVADVKEHRTAALPSGRARRWLSGVKRK